MGPRDAFVLVPLIGYVGLWGLGIALFLAYFRIFKVTMDLRHTLAMIQKVPAPLSIVTVPACSFVAFFTAERLVLGSPVHGATDLLGIAAVSLAATIVLDVLITVVGEKIDIRAFPVNLMYLLAWLVIIPSVMLAGR